MVHRRLLPPAGRLRQCEEGHRPRRTILPVYNKSSLQHVRLAGGW
jgi:hypothetical protein